MNSQEKLIIAKLLKIAQSQQKTIVALVKRAQQNDPIITYLQHTAQTAAFNAGLSGVQVSVDQKDDVDTDTLKGGTNIQPGNQYTVFVRGSVADNATKQKFIDYLNQTIVSQKPELDGQVNIIFSN